MFDLIKFNARHLFVFWDIHGMHDAFLWNAGIALYWCYSCIYRDVGYPQNYCKTIHDSVPRIMSITTYLQRKHWMRCCTQCGTLWRYLTVCKILQMHVNTGRSLITWEISGKGSPSEWQLGVDEREYILQTSSLKCTKLRVWSCEEKERIDLIRIGFCIIRRYSHLEIDALRVLQRNLGW